MDKMPIMRGKLLKTLEGEWVNTERIFCYSVERAGCRDIEKPFRVFASTEMHDEWILARCETREEAEKYLEELTFLVSGQGDPGQYLKTSDFFSPNWAGEKK